MIRTVKITGIFILLVLAFYPQSQVYAQGKQITGTVTSSENKQPVQGVTVTVKGTRNAVLTDAQGHFKINADNKATALLFSHTGFISSEVNITGTTAVSVELQADVKALEDVVVIGYQTIKRKDLLASVSSVSAKDLKDIPINSAAEALNGRLAGVTATTSEGSPDATISIRVRGGMSITGDNSPLYVIDGVQMENALSIISPQDIQSIDVLKDAAATAIYGARAANGVIIITTKSARPGRAKINYNGFVGIKNLPKTLDVLSPYDYVFYQSERSRGSSTDSTSFTNNFGHTWDTLSNYKTVGPVNWQDEVFGKTGVTRTHNISVSGGNQRIVYDFGYTNNNDKAIVINSSYVRNLLSFKSDLRINKNIKFGIITRYSYQNVYGAGVSDVKGSSYNRLRNAVKYRPFLSPGQDIDAADLLADPNVGNGLNLVNPLRLASAEYRKKTTETANFTAYTSINIIKNLTFKSTFGIIQNNFTDRQFNDSLTPYAMIQGGAKPIVSLDTTKSRTITNSNVFTYSIKGFKKKHDFDFLIGEETYEVNTLSRSSLFKGYPTFISSNDAFHQTYFGTPFTGYPKLGKTRYTSLSFFGRLNYSYKDKYLFSANIREDGSSKFGPGNRWGNFPSLSFAWRMKKEKFMEKVDIINDLKFRFGFGTIGNNRIGDYLYLTTFRNDGTYFYGINNSAVLAYYSSALVNQDLKWESMVNRNFGVDMTLLKNRINLSADYYINNSKDLLLNVPIASTYGYSTQYQNIGKTSNKGIEFQLNGVILRNSNGLGWNANFNISHNTNKIIKLGTNQTSFFPAASWGVSGQPTDYIAKIGSSVGAMWGLINDGFYKVSDFDYNTSTGAYTLKTGTVTNVGIIGPVQPGSIKFKDLNGDGVIDLNNDRTFIGDPTPDFTGGLNQQFTYRQWDLSLFVNFSVGNDVYNANKIEFTNGYSNNSNMLALMAGRWRIVTSTGQTAQWVSGGTVYGIPPDQLSFLNANATIWQPLKSAGAFYPSSWAIENGSFLRINNFTLGYSVPLKKLVRWKMNQLRFYFTANNLAVITGYSGYDPEVSVRSNPLTPGLDYSAYPKSRSFIFGINASFR
jgi:TonB-linked SusC/RagA family outer membrane protein